MINVKNRYLKRSICCYYNIYINKTQRSVYNGNKIFLLNEVEMKLTCIGSTGLWLREYNKIPLPQTPHTVKNQKQISVVVIK